MHSQRNEGILHDEVGCRELLVKHISSEAVEDCVVFQAINEIKEMIDRGEFNKAKFILLTIISKRKLEIFGIPLGYLYFYQNRYRESTQLYESAFNALSNSSYAATVFAIRINIADGYLSENMNLEVRALLKRDLDKLSKSQETAHPLIPKIYLTIAEAYYLEGKYAESEAILEQSLNNCIEQQGKESQVYAETLSMLGLLYLETGRGALAEPLMLESLEIKVKLSRERDPEIAWGNLQLCIILYDQRNFEKAEKLLLRTLEQFTPFLGATHFAIARCSNVLAKVYLATGRTSEATEICRKYVNVHTQSGEESREAALALFHLAKCYMRGKRLLEAESCLIKAASIYIRLYGEENMITITIHTKLGKVLYLEGKLDEAEILLKKVLSTLRKIYGEEYVPTAYCANILGYVHLRQGRPFDAEQLHLKSLEVYLKLFGRAHPRTLVVIRSLAADYLEEGKLLDADFLLQATFRIHMQHHISASSELAGISLKLADIYIKAKKKTEATLFITQYLEFCYICNPSEPLLAKS